MGTINSEIKNKNDLLQFIIEHSFCAVTIIDKNEIVQMTNKEHEILTGYASEYLVGMSLGEMIEKKIIDNSVSKIVLKRKETVLLEQTCHDKYGVMSVCLAKGVPYFNDVGEVEYVACYLFNMGEKRKVLEAMEADNSSYSLALLQNKDDVFEKLGIIYHSASMRTIKERAEIIARTDSTALILGESGVGKSLFARFLHDASRRSENTFLTINCGAVPESLIESELFGYERGAFTGAMGSGKKGLVELANEGTLFLDEIGDMPYSLQVKLLQLIQDKEFFRVGGTKPIKVDTRIIAATNVDLRTKVANREFREDLYYRLAVLELEIPPLRQRISDIPLLIETFKNRFNDIHNLDKTIRPEVVAAISNLELKGNVRELESMIERLVLFSVGKMITLDDLNSISNINSNDNLTQGLNIENRDYKSLIEEFDRQIFLKARALYKSKTEIGRKLNINQSTVSRKMQKYGIK